MTTTERAVAATGVVYDLQGRCWRRARAWRCARAWVGQDPDGGSCDAFNAYRFQHGTIGGIDVSGLSFINVVHIPGNVLAPGSWQVVSFVDDRASDEQFQAILDAYHGRLGGPLADLAGLVGEVLAVKRAPIVHETREGGGSLGVVLRGPQRHPVRLPHRLHRRAMSATLERGPAVTAAYAGRRRLPVAVPVAIALAWAAAAVAHATGVAGRFHHDALLGGGTPGQAGVFQFSSLKDRRLTECRHPAAYLLRHYRRGPRAAFRLGWGHGLYCLGCCWALMLVMFSASPTWAGWPPWPG